MAERRPSGVSEWMRGTVQNTNAKGVKLEGEDWINWSQYAPEDERVVPAKGTKVRVGVDNRGFLREIQDEHGTKLQPGAAGTSSAGSYGGGMRPEDQWRVTLLSCLSSAATLMTSMGDEALGGQKRSDATFNLAVHWARQAWANQMPKPVQSSQESDDAGE